MIFIVQTALTYNPRYVANKMSQYAELAAAALVTQLTIMVIDATK
jgi:hypothetical protein